MSLTIKYLDTPEGAQEAGTVTGTGLQPFSDTASMVSGAEDAPWATTEPGLWVLDGTLDILPDEPENIGWWSEAVSDDSGVFSAPPVITIDFAERFAATGITIIFSPSTQQWCTEIKIQWYRDGELIAELHAFPYSARWAGGDAVDSFDRIVIELLSTNNPGQMAKVQQIVVGQTIVFGRNEIISAQLVNEADYTLGSLSVDTSCFKLLSPDGLTLNPQKDQRMELYRDSTLLAAHYIESGSREAKGYYTFNCQSAVGMLTDDYLGGIYKKAPVEDVASEILDGRRYEIDDELKSAVITGYLPVCTRREALQQVAFAIGALVTTLGSDLIRMVPLPETESVVFADQDIFLGAKLTTSPRIAKYEVTAHSYIASKTEETLLEEEEIDDEDLLITFGDPHYDYAITGGTITGSGANWITVTASGAVTVTAKAYTHTTSVRSKKNPDATHAERSNVLSITEATLVNGSNVKDILNRLYTAGQWRQTLTQEVVVTDQQTGTVAVSKSPWGSQIRGIITSMDSTLTQSGHTARVTIVGEEV